MTAKTLIRLVDAAQRAGTTLPDVLALCTRGDDLHLDIYVTPPPEGWPGTGRLEHLDHPEPDGGFLSQPLGHGHLTDPILLVPADLRPWSDSVTLTFLTRTAKGWMAGTSKDEEDAHVREAVDLSVPITVTGELLEVSNVQWAGWIAQRGAEVHDADRRERLTRRVTAAVQAADDDEFAWKTEEAATAMSARIAVSRQSLSRWRSKATEKGLPVPSRRRTVGRSRADLWLPDVGLLAAWAALLEIEGIRGRGGGATQAQSVQVDSNTQAPRWQKRRQLSRKEIQRRLAEARKKRP